MPCRPAGADRGAVGEVVDREARLLGLAPGGLGDRLLDPRLLGLERVEAGIEDPVAHLEVVDPAAVACRRGPCAEGPARPARPPTHSLGRPCVQDAIARPGCWSSSPSPPSPPGAAARRPPPAPPTARTSTRSARRSTTASARSRSKAPKTTDELVAFADELGRVIDDGVAKLSAVERPDGDDGVKAQRWIDAFKRQADEQIKPALAALKKAARTQGHGRPPARGAAHPEGRREERQPARPRRRLADLRRLEPRGRRRWGCRAPAARASPPANIGPSGDSEQARVQAHRQRPVLAGGEEVDVHGGARRAADEHAPTACAGRPARRGRRAG